MQTNPNPGYYSASFRKTLGESSRRADDKDGLGISLVVAILYCCLRNAVCLERAAEFSKSLDKKKSPG
jgi:hypothetical protein